MKIWFPILGLFLSLFCACSSRKSIDAEVAQNGITLVDVRIPEQFEKSPVKNAVNIPLAELEQHLPFFKSQKKVIVFCNSGKQAGQALDTLKKLGFHNIINGKTWQNIYNMQTNFLNHLIFDGDKPSTHLIRKNETLHQFAVGLGKNTLLKKHTTSVPTTLMMVRGSVLFRIEGKDLHFKEGDLYEIPVNIEHEVIGQEAENVFIITKELK